MKILFLCGSLEPGKDGVGDYTRRLAGELARQGNSVSIIAYNDKHLKEEYSGSQKTEAAFVPVLRLPITWTEKKRFSKGIQWKEKFEPEWVSLQFVSFSYQKKGLPFNFVRNFKKLAIDVKIHIMFHELWVGINKEASIKHLLWGWCQKQLIRTLINGTKPQVVHTQSHLYIEKLREVGCEKINHLPLFGNVPFGKPNLTKKEKSDKSLQFILFGTIHPGAPLTRFCQEIRDFSETQKIKTVFTFIGRCGGEQKKWVRAFIEAGFEVQVLGEQSLECISSTLRNGSFGISTTPWAQTEKSGTVAAMLEHGLPVISVATPWTPRGAKEIKLINGVERYKIGNIDSFMMRKKVFMPSSEQTLQKISQQFLLTLR